MIQQHKSHIPLWVVASLGKKIAIKSDFDGAVQVYKAGSKATLVGIQMSDSPGRPYALVALDDHDLGYMENFAFDDLRPISNAVSFSLDMEEGTIGF